MKVTSTGHPPLAELLAVRAGSQDPAVRERAGQLAGRLGLTQITDDEPSPVPLLLRWDGACLSLHDTREPAAGGVSVDFSPLLSRRWRVGLMRRQPLFQAMGKRCRTVLDATAGLGQDLLLLWGRGYRLTAIERSPVVHALLEDGLRRLRQRAEREADAVPIKHWPKILQGDALTLIPGLRPAPDVIYLDPMFPPKRKKSALAKKELRLLKELVGRDPDALALLEVSRRVARQRVVVKRADDAPELLAGPAASYAGKTVRYDVYLPLKES
jgi:16S rRNA (guanine1516-N2)-methyltransferase